jgi:hypothetical protein
MTAEGVRRSLVATRDARSWSAEDTFALAGWADRSVLPGDDGVVYAGAGDESHRAASRNIW